MFNVECCKLHDRLSLKFFRGMLLNEHQKRGLSFSWGGCDLHRNYGMVVVLLSSFCNYDNMTLKLHQEKRCYPDEGWLFIGRFKVGSVPGIKH